MRSRALRSTLLSLQGRAEGKQGTKGVFSGRSGDELVKCIFVADLRNVGTVSCLTSVPAGVTGSVWCIILRIVVRVLHF